MFQGIRCRLGWHTWGALEGDSWGGFHTCTLCQKTKRFNADHPPDAHDPLGGSK
jgi:hypothetical protein